MSKQNQSDQGYAPRKMKKRAKKKKFIIPIILIFIIVYSLVVFSSDFIASVKSSFIPFTESNTLGNEGDTLLSQQKPSPETLKTEDFFEETLEQEIIEKDENSLHNKNSSKKAEEVNPPTKITVYNETKTETVQPEIVTNQRPPEIIKVIEVEAPPAKPFANNVVNHEVQQNETLFSITMKYYLSGSYQTKIADYNGINNPSTDIKAGMKLELPDPLIIAFHEIKKGETLYSISMNYYQGVNYQDRLASYNGIKDPTTDVKIGMVLQIPNFSIIEKQPKGTYIININKTTNKLIVYLDNKPIKTFSIATGKKPDLTPEGTFKIVNKVEKPWFNPENIPGGDSSNPLGSHWLGLNVPGTNGYIYGIHGTNNPASIGAYASKGCIRMYNLEILWLYQNLPLQTSVEIVS